MVDYETYCTVCGMAITTREKGTAFMDVRVVDYAEHCEMVVSFHVCQDCWQKMKDHMDGGLEEAVKRREELQRFDLIATDRRF
jgi:hypothetical protein